MQVIVNGMTEQTHCAVGQVTDVRHVQLLTYVLICITKLMIVQLRLLLYALTRSVR